MESKEEDEEMSQRNLSESPGPAVAVAIEGEEDLAVWWPQIVLEGAIALGVSLMVIMCIIKKIIR